MKIAIFDFGTSRAKLTFATKQNGKIKYNNYSFETKLGGLFETELTPQTIKEAKERLQNAVIELNKNLPKDEKIYRISVLTEIFRKFPELIEVLENEKSVLGEVKVITGYEEGLAFFRALSHSNQNNDFVLLDVGGGSIQVILQDENNILSIKSFPLGTYKLQELYQKEHRNFIPKHIAKDILNDIKNEFNKNLNIRIKADNLILGSNYMESFFNCASKASNVNLLTKNNYEKINLFLNEHLLGTEYTQQAKYFLENPRFMYGADKALLVCLSLANHFDINNIIPTNESVSTSLAKLSFDYLEKEYQDNFDFCFENIVKQ